MVVMCLTQGSFRSYSEELFMVFDVRNQLIDRGGGLSWESNPIRYYPSWVGAGA